MNLSGGCQRFSLKVFVRVLPWKQETCLPSLFVMLSAYPHAVRSNARQYNHLVAVLGKLRSGLLVDLGVLLRIRKLSPCSLLPLVVRGALDLSPLLESAGVMSATNRMQRSRYSETHLSTTSLYFQPNSWPRRPRVQYLRPGLRRRTRRACGTTMRFLWSYGGGTPSNVFRRSIAAAPRAVLCGIIPRTVRQNILDGAR